jgi:Isochorismatase family
MRNRARLARSPRRLQRVVFVSDACGSATALGHDISLRRLEQAGITVTTTAAVSAELAGDYPTHSRTIHGG